ncbi:MAG: MATE family multidrug resistance protein, partial [Alcanivorax sp.]
MFSRSTLKELFYLALPMMVSQGAFAVMVFTDRIFMSRIDAMHIAATLGGGVSFFVSIALFNGILSYGNALVAQYLGAGEFRKCPQVVTQGLLLTLAILPVVAVVTYYVSQLFEAMGHDPAMVVLERQYYFMLMSGAGFALLKTCLACYFSGIAVTRVVMVSDLLGVAMNIPLSYVLIFGVCGAPEMGIRGAALGTVISTIFSIAVYLLFYFNRSNREKFSVLDSFKLNTGILKRYLRLGFPSGFELFIGAGTFNLFLLMFQSYGVSEGAAMAIVFNWDMLSFVPLVGINIAITSLIGRYVGAQDLSRASAVISSGFLIALTYSGLMGLCFIVFRFELLELFATPGEDFTEIRKLGSKMMIGLTTYVMADAVILICSGTLRGAGDTRWLMVTSIVLHLIMLLVQYLVIMVWEFEPIVSWWVFVAT